MICFCVIENGVGEKGKSVVMSQNIIDVRDETSPFNSRITIAERRHKFEVLAKLQDFDGGNSVKKPPKMLPKKATLLPKNDHATGKESADEKPDSLTPCAVNASSNPSQSNTADDLNSQCKNGATEEKGENEPDAKDHSSTVEQSGEDIAKQPASVATKSSGAQENDSTALDTVSIASVGSIRRKNLPTSVSSTNADNTNEDDASDDDASNLMALRQSVNFAHRWCEGVDSTRSRLEEQAQRLSKRFTHLHHGKGLDVGKSLELGVLVESPASPSPSSGGFSAVVFGCLLNIIYLFIFYIHFILIFCFTCFKVFVFYFVLCYS